MVDIEHAQFIRFKTAKQVAIDLTDLYGDVVVMCDSDNPVAAVAQVSKEFKKLLRMLDRKIAEQRTMMAKNDLYRIKDRMLNRVFGVYRSGDAKEMDKVNTAFIGRDVSLLWPTSLKDYLQLPSEYSGEPIKKEFSEKWRKRFQIE